MIRKQSRGRSPDGMSLLYGVMRATTTTCWGVGIGLFLCLPAAAAAQAGRGQPVPPPKTPPKPLWSLALEATQHVDLATDDTAVYVTGGESGLVAYAADDGRVLWARADRTEPALRQFGRFGDALITVASSGIEALDPASGVTRWTAALASEDALLTGDATVVVVGSGAGLRVIDVATGAVAWKVPAEAAVVALGLDTARVVAVLANGSLASFERATGRTQWTVPVHGAVSGLRVAGERIYVLDRNGVLYAHHARDGSRAWYFERFIEGGGRPAVDDQRVYAAFFDNTLQAFDRKSGARQWHAALTGRPSGSPWMHEGHVLVAQADGIVAVLSADGTRVAELASRKDPGGEWEVRLEAGGPVGSTGSVYTVATDESGVRALSIWPRTK